MLALTERAEIAFGNGGYRAFILEPIQETRKTDSKLERTTWTSDPCHFF
jgi:hypothetical protein